MTDTDTNKEREAAEQWLRDRYGAYRGHFAWRELEEAFQAGRASLAVGAHNIVALSPLPQPAHNERVYGGHGDEVVYSYYTEHQMREYARQEVFRAEEAWQARASLAASAGSEPVAWTGGEEWEQLAWHLCAEEHGEDACDEVIWEGGPIPEPWGARWMKYESDAKRMIELVRRFYTHPSPPEGAGTVSVPKEPTAEMKLAAQKADMDHSDHEEWLHENWPDFKRVWDAMIAASPRDKS